MKHCRFFIGLALLLALILCLCAAPAAWADGGLVIPNGVTYIEEEAFYGCSRFTSVTIPESVTGIGRDAFYGCDAVEAVYYGGSELQWAALTMDSGNDVLTDAALHFANPTIVVQPVSEGAFLGEDAVFTVKASVEGLRYQWQYRTSAYGTWKALTDSDCTGQQSESLTIPVTKARDGLRLRCMLTDGVGTVYSKEVTLTVKELREQGTWGTLSWQFYSDGQLVISGSGAMDAFSNGDKTNAWRPYKNDVKTVQILSGVTSISGYAFSGCYYMTSVEIPESVTSIDQFSFSNCEALTSVTVPESVLSIGNFAFYDCRSMTTVTISEGVTRFSIGSFQSCTSLQSITLPTSLKSIGPKSFSGCSNLKDVYYNGLESQWNTISVGSDNEELTSATIHFSIPDTYQRPSISEQPQDTAAVENRSAVFTVTATGDDLHYQWQYYTGSDWEELTDSDCTGLQKARLTVPATAARNGLRLRCAVSNEAETVYSNAATLTLITSPSISTQPKSVTANEGTSATFTVTATGGSLSYQWQYYTGSSWAKLTDSDCAGLQTAKLTVPATAARNGLQLRCAVSNGAGTVYSEAALLTVNTKPIIKTQPESVTAAETSSATFTVMAAGDSLSYQWQYYTGSGWVKLTDSDCTGLQTATLTIPATMARNGLRLRCAVTNSLGTVYSEAATLTVLRLPVITSQPEDATVNESTQVTFRVAATGDNLRYQWQVRDGDDGTWTDFPSMVSPSAVTDTLSFTVSGTASGKQYRCAVSNDNGTAYSEEACLTVIVKTVSGTWGSLSWTLKAGALSITGKGAMPSFTEDSTDAWRAYSSNITSVTIGSGITSIGDYAFYRCHSIRSISIPTSVTTIGDYALAHCIQLTQVKLPEGVKSLGAYSFFSCTHLEDISLPSTLTTIGKTSFYACSALKDIVLPSGLTTIQVFTFAHCSGLETVYIPVSVKLIDNSAFYECNALKTIYYGGTQNQWYYSVSIENHNDSLIGVPVLFEQ